MKNTYTIVSHDTKFQRTLIGFLGDYKMVEGDSTLVHISEGDGLAENERLRASIGTEKRMRKDSDDQAEQLRQRVTEFEFPDEAEAGGSG